MRLRIILALADVERTPQQIAATMSDVPSSSIYRHLQTLLAAGLIEVAAERPVRGKAQLGTGVFWTANLGAAVLFGVGHVPVAAALLPVTAPLIFQIVVVNARADLVFG